MPSVDIWMRHRGQELIVTLPADQTSFADFAERLEAEHGLSRAALKLLLPGGRALTLPRDAAVDLTATSGIVAIPNTEEEEEEEEEGEPARPKNLPRLMATPVSALASMEKAGRVAAARQESLQKARAFREKVERQATRARARALAASPYTFREVRALETLPNAERSRQLLCKLRDDAGIRAVMAKHELQVGLLTEMEPLSNTQVDVTGGVTRLLGLNRNRGGTILLRLRTDAGDGYRDYKTIRRTLCHELAHNRFSDHDRHFWDFCHTLEREVEQLDWQRGGHSLDGFHYQPSREDIPDDHGVQFVREGSRVLGSPSPHIASATDSTSASASSSSAAAPSSTSSAPSLRELRARAAEQRSSKQQQ